MLKKLYRIKNNFGYIVLESYVAFILFGTTALTMLSLSVFLQKQVQLREQSLEAYRFVYEISEEIKNIGENRLKQKKINGEEFVSEVQIMNESVYFIAVKYEEKESKIELLSKEN